MAGDARVSDRDDDRDGDRDTAGAAPRALRSDIAAPRVAETRGPDSPPGRAPDRAAPHEAQQTAGGPQSAPALGRNPEVEESRLPPHEPGAMDITAHEETYQGFIRWTIRAVLAILAVLIFLALFNT